MATEIKELQRIRDRIKTEKESLKTTLDALTTNGQGILYDIKIAVGADSELGTAVGNLGGKVLQASDMVMKDLDEFIRIMNDNLARAEADLSDTAMEIGNFTSQIDNIDFSD